MWWLFRSSPSAPWVLSLMRIVVSFMFLSVGTMKMFGFPSRGGAVIGVDPFTQIGLAAIIEVFGGTLVLLGLATRPVAFILSGEMAVAYFQVYAPRRHSFRSSTAATRGPVLLDLLLSLVCWRRPLEPRRTHRVRSHSIGAGEGGVMRLHLAELLLAVLFVAGVRRV